MELAGTGRDLTVEMLVGDVRMAPVRGGHQGHQPLQGGLLPGLGRPMTGMNRLPHSPLFFGTESTAINSVGMEELGLRSLERICRIQAALTTHEATKRVLETMEEEYRRQAEFQDRRQAQES
jgi:hypothetical protein